METKSPNQKIIEKLRRNFPAVAGLIVIGLSIFTAIFAYVIVPDNTPNANEQFPSLALQAPGFSVQMLVLKKENQNSSSFLNGFFNGKERIYELIPIQNCTSTNNETITITKYNPYNESGFKENIPSSSVYKKNGVPVIKIKQFILGTDNLGRDVFSRLIVGARVSLIVGFIAVLVATLVGIFIGSIAGFYRGWVDKLVMWKLSVFWSIPTLLLAMALYIGLKDFFASSYLIIITAIGLTMWVEMARVVRGQIFALREIQFVEAAHSLGFSDFRVMFRHIVPNLIGPIVVIMSSNFANAILIEAGLSFLGLGIQPPSPSWGGMLSEFKDMVGTNLSYLAIFPGFLIMLLVLSFNLVGNGLRDAIDIKRN